MHYAVTFIVFIISDGIKLKQTKTQTGTELSRACPWLLEDETKISVRGERLNCVMGHDIGPQDDTMIQWHNIRYQPVNVNKI